MNGSLRLMELSFLFTAIPKLSTTSAICCVCVVAVSSSLLSLLYIKQRISRGIAERLPLSNVEYLIAQLVIVC